MSFSGFTREIDSVGRVVIPKQICKELGLTQVGTKVSIISEDNRIIIRKLTDSCVFCNSITNLIKFNGEDICSECLKKLNQMT